MADIYFARLGFVLKHILISGEFTSTLKDSADLSPPMSSGANYAIAWDGENMGANDANSDVMVYFSGSMTTTIKSTVDVTSINEIPRGMCFDQTDCFWAGTTSIAKMYLQSGKMTSTIKTSVDMETPLSSTSIGDLDYDGTDMTLTDRTNQEIVRLSGVFSSTIKSSITVVGTGTGGANGVYTNGTDTIGALDAFTPAITDWFKKYSGKITSTIKDSLDVRVAFVVTTPGGMETSDFETRLGLAATPTHITSASTGRVNMYYPTGRALKGKLEAADHTTATVIAWEDINGNTYTPGVGDRFIIFDVRITNATGSNSVTVFQDDDDDNANDAGEMVYEAEFLDQGIDSHSFTQPLATAVMNASTDGLHLISTAAGATSVVILAQVLQNQN